jgi:hypothetical protein
MRAYGDLHIALWSLIANRRGAAGIWNVSL